MKKKLQNIHIISCIAILFALLSPPLCAKDGTGGDVATTVFFANQDLLDPVFERLYQLEQSRAWKINIVHVGDSHIQADFLTNVIRQALQVRFGDGGYGFTFPYSLMRTNGTSGVKYTSNASWKSRLNVSPVSKIVDIGLSGIGLYTEDTNFTLQLSANSEWTFNSIKVLYSTTDSQYNMSLTNNPVTTFVAEDVADDEQIEHRIRRGESLSVIAVRYKTTVEALKQENGLNSDNIQAGRTITIPSSADVKRTTRKAIKRSVDYVDLQNYPLYSSYLSSDPLNRISIFSKGNKAHDINGFVLENDEPGLIYHGIGVNGAKLFDFNKYPLFFKQLSILKPDMVVLSFGTNESYQTLPVEEYIEKTQEMAAKIKAENPNAVVMVMTPPPSLMRRRMPNPLIGRYSKALMELTNIPIWDLYGQMGGEDGITGNGKSVSLISSDKIHYTLKGYEAQGGLFSADFIKAYNQYKGRRKD